MKILYLLKKDPDETAQELIAAHQQRHDVTILDLRKEKRYAGIVDLIDSSDKVISW